MSRRPAAILVVLLLLAAAHSSWNAYTRPAFMGYDGKAHAQYLATLVDEGRLPHPLEGWSTFHPPLYYLLASLVAWPSRPILSPLPLQGLSALAILAAGLVSYLLVLRLGGGLAVAGVATALVLFVPCSQLAGLMLGNEALGAGLAALALPALLTLQANPRNLRAAAVAGLIAGLALATKYTGFFVAAACAVPFCRVDFDRRTLHALVLCTLVGAVVAGPVYVRNIKLTGSPIPMTRELEPMKSAEARYMIRERRLVDYLWLAPGHLLQPSINARIGKWAGDQNDRHGLTSVWGLTYASTWYDAFAHRVPEDQQRERIYAGPLLTLLGIVPTAIMVAGFIVALWELLRRRSGTPDAPLIVMSALGLLTFVAFTFRAPSVAALKASYMLPLLAPAAVFFARGIGLLGARLRVAALLISGAAALAAATVFTNGLVFPRVTLGSEAGLERSLKSELESSQLAIIDRELQSTALGRWQKAEPPLRMDDWRILWRIAAHDFPSVNETATAAWCIYVGELMDRHLPQQRWLAVFAQKGVIARTCNDQNWRSIRHPFLNADLAR